MSHKPIEEAFAKALRLRLKIDPDWCYREPTRRLGRPVKAKKRGSKKELYFNSITAFIKTIGIKLPYGVQLPYTTRDGWTISYVDQH